MHWDEIRNLSLMKVHKQYLPRENEEREDLEVYVRIAILGSTNRRPKGKRKEILSSRVL